LQIGKIVSDVSTYDAFLNTFGSVCEEGTMTISGIQACTTDSQSTNAQNTQITIQRPVVVSYGMTFNVNDGLIQEQVQMKFPDLEFGDGSSSGSGSGTASNAVPVNAFGGGVIA